MQVNLLGSGVITVESTYRGKKDKGLGREENRGEW